MFLALVPDLTLMSRITLISPSRGIVVFVPSLHFAHTPAKFVTSPVKSRSVRSKSLQRPRDLVCRGCGAVHSTHLRPEPGDQVVAR